MYQCIWKNSKTLWIYYLLLVGHLDQNNITEGLKHIDINRLTGDRNRQTTGHGKTVNSGILST